MSLALNLDHLRRQIDCLSFAACCFIACCPTTTYLAATAAVAVSSVAASVVAADGVAAGRSIGRIRIRVGSLFIQCSFNSECDLVGH